jgi:hypothetical protein
MENILIKNTILKDKILISFDLQDGNIPFSPFELLTSGDIELNSIVIKLSELLELNKEVKYEYEDSLSLLETDSKIKLVKETLDEIYNSFNLNIIVEEQIEDLF